MCISENKFLYEEVMAQSKETKQNIVLVSVCKDLCDLIRINRIETVAINLNNKVIYLLDIFLIIF